MTKQWSNAISILCCYAPEDHALHDDLKKHLASLKRLNHIAVWYDEEVQASTKWVNWFRGMLKRSSVTLFLISSDFMASDCSNILLEEAVGISSTHVIPILLRSTDYEDTPITQLQMLPSEAKPITMWSNRDEAFLDVVRGIRRAMASILAEEVDSIRLFRQDTSVPSLLVDETGAKKTRKEEEGGEQAETAANEILLFCEQGISLDPYNVIFYKMKAAILEKIDSGDLFLKRLCEEAIQKFPEEQYFRNIRSQLYLDDYKYSDPSQSLSDLSQSLEECEQMLQINPTHLDLYIRRAHVLYELERYNEAITAYEGIIASTSEIGEDIYYYLGEALYATGQYEEAIKNFNLHTTFIFHFPIAYVKKGQALSALGKHEDASVAYEEAKERSPEIDLYTQKKGHPLTARDRGNSIY